MTISQENFEVFLKFKNLENNSKQMPYSIIDEFLKVYLDDIAIYTLKSLENLFQLYSKSLN